TNSATLVIYHDPTSPGGSMTLGGNSSGGAIGNRPQNFLYFGLPNVASITLSGTSDFVGAIYAPTASLTLNGGGHGNNLMGSAIVNQVTLNGHYDFHYDESLANYGPPRGFIPITWQEL
ncbi:MAG TPA: collagen-binding domain-containing protein, partial [Verrucomicrobiae bacterium]|nr:collagen-binding domain-containing protein [Verrucomicrobiae bacterium]